MNRRRVGVIGLGMASPPHIQSLLDLSDRVEVAGAFSPTPERRIAFAARYGLPVVETADALFDDPAISALIVLAPPDKHVELVRRAADAGKHVLLEKPLAETPAGSVEVVEVMERAGLTLGMVFQHRFRKAAEELRVLLDAGVLGEPLTAAVSVRWWRDGAYYSQPGRGMKARDGGGVLLTQAIHTLDLFVSLLGLPSEVVGFSGTTPLRRIDSEDVVCAALRWPNGLMATVNATTAAYPGFPERIEIAGTRGSAILSGDRLEAFPMGGEAIRIGDDGGTLGGGADPMAFSHAHHRAVLADFLDALDQGRKPRADGREALKVHRLIEMLLAA
jgi:predicted dehydrogenase